MTVAITDVVLRDAHQSLFATRLRLDDMLPVAAQLDWTTSATARWSAGAAPPLTPASAFSARTRGSACAS
ncbi:oxaloacetate decarboxylase [Klebsiella pneumoniae]|nr:oxaloacetate decarboxylase [Klebsiella pneumoniae]